MGRDASFGRIQAGARYFNPRARVGRDTTFPSTRRCRPYFNPRARVGRDQNDCCCLTNHLRFQSTRPRGARQVIGQFAVDGDDISIHAPAWGATRRCCGLLAHVGISIHAPAWGATSAPCADVDFFLISIHAPAWGATIVQLFRHGDSAFQSTRPRGARHETENIASARRKFQSTRPRGARR